MGQIFDFSILPRQYSQCKRTRPSDAESFLCSINAHYAVAATGTSGEATEGCPFRGVKKAEFAPFAPVSLHSQASCVHAQRSTREHNL